MKRFGLIILAFAFLCSCATTPKPTREQIDAADCGPSPTNQEELIRGIMEHRLFDPYSAVYVFSKPEKGWNNMGGEPKFGWKFCGTINAKNQMGGYVGAKPFYAMVNNGRVTRFMYSGVTIPDSFLAGMFSAMMIEDYKRTGDYESFCKGNK